MNLGDALMKSGVFKPLIPSSMYRFTQAFTDTKLMSVRQPWRLKDRRPSAEQRGNAYRNNASRLSEIPFRVRGVAPPSTPILLAFPYLTIEREYLIFILYRLILFSYLIYNEYNNEDFPV